MTTDLGRAGIEQKSQDALHLRVTSICAEYGIFLRENLFKLKVFRDLSHFFTLIVGIDFTFKDKFC